MQDRLPGGLGFLDQADNLEEQFSNPIIEFHLAAKRHILPLEVVCGYALEDRRACRDFLERRIVPQKLQPARLFSRV